MWRRTQRDADRRVIARLREEAEQSCPAFSEELHNRLRAAVLPVAAHAPIRVPHGAWTLATAAALIVVAGMALLGWFRISRVSTSPAAVVAAWSSLPESAQLGVQEINRLADGFATWQPWTDLDHDARLAASAVAESFPLQGGRESGGARGERLD
jgi:hypothetical protein